MKRGDLREKIISKEMIRGILAYSFLFGIVAHGSVMSKALLWHDGLIYAYRVSADAAVKLGRWMRALLAGIVSAAFGGNNLAMPLLYGVISLFFIAASAYVIIRLFHIEEKLLQVILCGLMVSLPVVTSTFYFMFTAPYYFLGLFLSVTGVWAARELAGAKGFVTGVLCVCCALGIYQAYFAVSVSLFVILLIFDIVNDRNATLAPFFKRAFGYLGICVAGFASYFIVWKLVMRVMGLTATEYQGVSSFGTLAIVTYLKSALVAYARFFLLHAKTTDNLYPMGLKAIQIVVIGLSIICSAYLVAHRFKENKAQGVLLALLIAILPLCFNVVYLIGAENIHTVMLYGQCMLYVYLILAIRHILRSGAKPGRFFYRLTAGVLLLLVAMNIYFDNGCYMKAEVVLQQTINNMNVLVGRIKSLDDYKDTMPVCIAIKGKKDATVTPNNAFSDFALVPLNQLSPHGGKAALRNLKEIMKEWCGFSPKYVSYDKFEHKEVFDEMPDYPDAGSVRIVDGTVVVRM